MSRKYRRQGRKASHERRRANRRTMQQNFLRNERAARRIVGAAKIGYDDVVVEFGAGVGALTRPLSRKARRVVAVEYDPYWVAHLKERFARDENVEILHADALSVPLPKEPFRVVANVPFYITTAILHRLLDDPTSPPEIAHLLVQKEVALKHARSSPTTLKTLSWSPWYRLSTVLDLPAESFHPVPEVDARLLVATKRGPPLVDPGHRHLFRAFVDTAFNGHGNTVGRVLGAIFTRRQLRRLAHDNEFNLDRSPSELTVRQWAGVFEFMVGAVPRDRWPPTRQYARREVRRR